MKKMLSILLVCALALCLLVTGTPAAGHRGGGSCRNNSLCYQDTNGVGLCDNQSQGCVQGLGNDQGHHGGR